MTLLLKTTFADASDDTHKQLQKKVADLKAAKEKHELELKAATAALEGCEKALAPSARKIDTTVSKHKCHSSSHVQYMH